MLTIGIDVGVTGALVSIDGNGDVVFVGDLPIASQGSSKWVDGGRLLRMLFAARRGQEPARVFVEKIHGTPKMGVTTSHSMGLTLGSVISILQVAELPFELVVPGKWKRALNLIMPNAKDSEKKQASLDRARMLFPRAPLDLVKHNNRAEALLIAHYGQRYVMGVAALHTSAAASAAVGELALVGRGKAA